MRKVLLALAGLTVALLGGCGTQTPETDAEFCTRHGKDCGTFTDLDNDGLDRTVDCGTCSAPEICGGGGVDNVCAEPECTPETAAELCTRHGKDCDEFTGTDNCGAERTVDCGTCSAPESCGGGGVDNVCAEAECTPETDAELCTRLEKDCDEFTGTDNCGAERTVDCGTCSAPEICGGGGVDNVCAEPECTPETDAEICTRLQVQCGEVTEVDNCGTTRTVDCGDCTGVGESCSEPKWLIFSDGADGGLASDSDDTRDHSGTFGTADCGGENSPDVVYSFTTSQVLNLHVTVSPQDGLEPVLSLRTTCELASTQEVCSIGTTSTGTLQRPGLPAGSYFLIVDGSSSSAGRYTLEASLTPPAQGDACPDPKPLTFSNGTAGGTASDSDDTRDFFDYFGTAYCGLASGPDVVYSFTTSQVLDMNVTLTPQDGLTPVLSLRTTCERSYTEESCSTGTTSTGTLQKSSLPAGTHFLIVDGASDTAGRYTLEASLGTP